MIETEIDYDGVFTRKTPEEVKQMLDEYLADGESNGSDGTQRYAKKSEDQVDKAFSSLLSA